jgi:adenine deaminase
MKILKGRIVDVVKGEVFSGEVYVENNRVSGIERNDTIRESRLILPGLVDSHIHIESSMLTPSRFAEAVIPHGTVATVSDPHEIANVLGINGVDFMIENSRLAPLKVFFGAPSCVPATGFETSGAKIGEEEIGNLLSRPEIRYLSEMMNYPGVIYDDEEVKKKLQWAKHYNKPVDGHAPGLRGKDLEKYISEGVSTDHECSTIEEAIEKIEKGMIIQIREGSAARNFEKLYPLIDRFPDQVMLCSDDLHPDQLSKGHINLLVKRALDKGLDPMKVLRSVTLNPVRFYKLDVGLLQEGDPADFVVVDNLENFNILECYIDGEKVFWKGRLNFKTSPSSKPNNFFSNQPSTEDIQVKDLEKNVKIIRAIDGEIFTEKYIDRPLSRNGYLKPDVEKDILKIVVQNRYKEEKPALGFIKNFGLKEGGMVSTIAHDSHNIICVGTSDRIILELINWVNMHKGGIAFHNGERISGLPLPVGGILTDKPAREVAEKYNELENEAKKAGSKLQSPFMTLSFMSLLVIPELKLGNRGLFDVKKFDFTDLYAE